MSIRILNLLAVAALLTISGLVCPTYAVVIGDWESGMDGWIDWGKGATYTPGAGVGVTLNSGSLRVDQSGWGQSLSIKLQDNGLVDAFMNNSYFSIDVSVAANDGSITGGYSQVYSVSMNAAGPGFTTVAGDTPINFYWWSGSTERTQTLIVDYSDFRNAITSTGYVEIVLTLNTGDGAPTDMYFDNARLYGGLGILRAYAEEVLSDEPVLYLRLEEDTAVNTSSGFGPQADSSGSNYWAAHRAETLFIPNGGIGNCRYLLGLVDDPGTSENEGNRNGIAGANSTEFPGWTFDFSDDYAFAPDDITFEFWYNTIPATPADANGLRAYGIFFQQVKADYSKAPGMAYNEDGTFRVLTGDPNLVAPESERWWYTGVTAPVDGQWHQVVITYQESYGTADEMAIQLYLDGDFAASTVVGGPERPAKLGPELDHVVIGGANDIGWTYSDYTGYIDEFAIYAGVLAADRIGIHYGAGLCAMSRGDLTGDCKVDLQDFAELASTWLLCNDPALFGTDPDCGPTW